MVLHKRIVAPEKESQQLPRGWEWEIRGALLTSHVPPLVVKVAENHENALVFLAEEVLDRDLDVVVSDECSPCRGRVGRLDGLRLESLAALDKQDA